MKNIMPVYSKGLSVLNWGRIMHKGARTNDGAPVGNIAAEDQDYIVIFGARSKQYRIPKSSVKVFDGSEVHLSLSIEELSNYRL